MMFDTTKIEEKDGKLYVYVELPFRNDRAGVAKMTCRASDVATELESRNLTFGECLEGRKLQNWREDTRKGTYVFSKKTLDKAEESVIIKEEKVVKPKPTRKKRTTKASTRKKVSTGE